MLLKVFSQAKLTSLRLTNDQMIGAGTGLPLGNIRELFGDVRRAMPKVNWFARGVGVEGWG